MYLSPITKIASPISVDTGGNILFGGAITESIASPSVPLAVSPQSAVTAAGGANQNTSAAVTGSSPLPTVTGPLNLPAKATTTDTFTPVLVFLGILAVGYAFLRLASKRV